MYWSRTEDRESPRAQAQAYDPKPRPHFQKLTLHRAKNVEETSIGDTSREKE